MTTVNIEPADADETWITHCDDPVKVASGAAAIVVLTEWPEFRVLDWGRLADVVERRVVIDTRNLLDADVLRRVGFEVRGVGRQCQHLHSVTSSAPASAPIPPASRGNLAPAARTGRSRHLAEASRRRLTPIRSSVRALF